MEIKKQLKSMGFDNIYCIYSLGNDSGWYDPKEIIKNKGNIVNLFRVLEDKKSKFILESILKIRYTQDLFIYEQLFEGDQYFPENIINLNPNEIFVDAGAYDGDTVDTFINKSNGNFDKIYAFEPDDKSYLKLVKKLEQLNLGERIKTYKKGLSDKKAIVRFMSTSGDSSNINDCGNELIETVNLDCIELFQHENVNNLYIKMDIEGEELNALMGAKNIIMNKKPKLAICIYYKSEHLWKIPLFIKFLVPEYRIYIRHHSQDVRETVCYAVI
ncbi:FkbM family methyltransferase [Clostridium sp.]|uniref:FkbM family methyltransferase n=1 Tax=Clostridium sp. TaxID=1506 RepID=UPI002FDCA192